MKAHQHLKLKRKATDSVIRQLRDTEVRLGQKLSHNHRDQLNPLLGNQKDALVTRSTNLTRKLHEAQVARQTVYSPKARVMHLVNCFLKSFRGLKKLTYEQVETGCRKEIHYGELWEELTWLVPDAEERAKIDRALVSWIGKKNLRERGVGF